MSQLQKTNDTHVFDLLLLNSLEQQYDFLRFTHTYRDLFKTEALDIHLQWFAVEDEGKTFDPTERKIKKAREEGKVSKSQEIPSSLILLVVTTLLWVFGVYYANNFKELFMYYLTRLQFVENFGFENETISFVKFMLVLVLPIIVTVFVFAIIGNVIQFGWAPSVAAIRPRFSKIALRFDKWAKKVFSIQGAYNTGTSLLKIALVICVIYLNLFFRIDTIAGSAFQSFNDGVTLAIRMSLLILFECGIIFLFLGIIDFHYQKYLFRKELKMTFQEVKEEFKETEGDPEVKKRILNRMSEYLNRDLPNKISDSDVVITNPTHFAVAVKYDVELMDAPFVTAKGEDEVALRIRKLAKELDVPIIENKPLARALYNELNVNDEIPRKYYDALVIIFKELYKIKG